jgi:hypothetical protein
VRSHFHQCIGIQILSFRFQFQIEEESGACIASSHFLPPVVYLHHLKYSEEVRKWVAYSRLRMDPPVIKCFGLMIEVFESMNHAGRWRTSCAT